MELMVCQTSRSSRTFCSAPPPTRWHLAPSSQHATAPGCPHGTVTARSNVSFFFPANFKPQRSEILMTVTTNITDSWYLRRVVWYIYTDAWEAGLSQNVSEYFQRRKNIWPLPRRQPRTFQATSLLKRIAQPRIHTLGRVPECTRIFAMGPATSYADRVWNPQSRSKRRVWTAARWWDAQWLFLWQTL